MTSISCASWICTRKGTKSSPSQLIAGRMLFLFSLSMTFRMIFNDCVLSFVGISLVTSVDLIRELINSFTEIVLAPLNAYSVLVLISMIELTSYSNSLTS